MIAILADTHMPRGGRRLPAECVRVLERASLIVHAGDLIAEPVLDELSALAPVAAVHGNVDEPSLRARLPERLELTAEGVRIGVVHDPGPAAGRHERLRGWFPRCDLVVYGHTHVPELTRSGSAWILNPGSPSERRRAPMRSMAVVRAGEPELLPLP